MSAPIGRAGVREVLALAVPATLSYALNNAYRMNDQYWIQGLGRDAQAALGAVMYVAVLNFSAFYLSGAGALALVARARGRGVTGERDSLVRHALLLSVLIGAVVMLLGSALTGPIVGFLELAPGPAAHAEAYLSTLYLVSLPMALAPTVDHIFLGLGNAWIPMTLQGLAVLLNYALDPLLIYGAHAQEAHSLPGVELLSALGAWLASEGILPEAGLGASGAALATGISRAVAVLLGLCALRFGFDVAPFRRGRPRLAQLQALVRISWPVCASTALYAGVYTALLKLVMSALPPESTAGLGLGFQVFEGLSFPCYVGVGAAVAALVGQSLGAGEPERALAIVRSGRRVGRVVGVSATVLFLAVSRPVAACFTSDPGVLAETLLYVHVLAFSQYFVAVEALNERVLLGAGFTRPILAIGMLGNALRVPLAWLLALRLGYGAAGVWWAINVSTWSKAFFYWREVQRGRWLSGPRAALRAEQQLRDERALRDEPPIG